MTSEKIGNPMGLGPPTNPAPSKTRIRIEVSYDGTDFIGWQKQPHSQDTVQGCLENALSLFFSTPISLVGAGRTDTGVHAVSQMAHFDVPWEPERIEMAGQKLIRSIESLTPDSLTCKGAWICPNEFHAQKSAVYKTYRYVILNRPVPSALRRRYTWWRRRPLNLDCLNEMSRLLLGSHDFRSFQSAGSDVKSTVRTVYEALWTRPHADTFVFTITGSGFLKQMVRNIVGTLIGLHERPDALKTSASKNIQAILDAKNRRMALATAPPMGLHLLRIYYPAELDNKCRKL